MFRNPEKGDFTIEDNSLALKLGFKNFPMDKFGVQKPKLKAIAKQPDIPELNIISFQKEGEKTRNWLGATIKNIETIEEQSASGLHSMDGVIVLEVKDENKLALSGIKKGDVIVELEDVKVKNISELLDKYQENLWQGSINLSIIRNQREMKVPIELK